ncbi:MAG TPA: hypothetical protein VGC56_10600 [Allosphingosinicella sp.]
MRLAFLLLASGSLAGCATTSFAPPSVDLENQTRVVGSNSSMGERCMPTQRLDANQALIPITEDVTGARRLIDNFIYMYRCRAHSAANGRQASEIPAFLALIGTAAATAFGAGPNVAIAGTVGNSLFTNGGKYYAPQRKAEIYDHALDAMLCIKEEAVGLDGYTLEAIGTVENAQGKSVRAAVGDSPADDSDPTIRVTVSAQYFDMVAGALLSIERVAAQKLSTAGTPFDAAGVIAELEKAEKAKTDAEAKEKPKADADAKQVVEAAKPAGAAATPQDMSRWSAQLNNPDIVRSLAGVGGSPNAIARQLRLNLAQGLLATRTEADVATTLLHLRTLQPRLQKCILRAKV